MVVALVGHVGGGPGPASVWALPVAGVVRGDCRVSCCVVAILLYTRIMLHGGAGLLCSGLFRSGSGLLCCRLRPELRSGSRGADGARTAAGRNALRAAGRTGDRASGYRAARSPPPSPAPSAEKPAEAPAVPPNLPAESSCPPWRRG